VRITIALFALMPIAAHAEVMDKELSFVTVALVALVGAVVALFAARLKPWFLLLVIPMLGLFFFAHLSEVTDPYVGPAMAREAGILYIAVSWSAPLLILLGAALGLVFRSRHVTFHA